jgi:PAS domain S-box-containing protein
VLTEDLETVRITGQAVSSEARFVNSGGGKFWARIDLAPWSGSSGFNGYLCALTDITEKKRAIDDLIRQRGRLAEEVEERTGHLMAEIEERRRTEEALRASERRYRDLFEHLTDAVIIHDFDGRTTHINQQGLRLFGRSDDHASDLRLADLWPPDDLDRYLERCRRLEAGRADETELRIGPEGRSPRHFEVKFKRMDPDGSRVLAVLRDVTERKMLEENVIQSRKLESLGLIAGGVAHDFNNLLMGMTGYAELALRAGELPQPKNRYLEQILGLGAKATELTRNMLAYSGQATFSPEILNVARHLQSLLALMKLALPANVALDCDLARSDATVEGDATGLGQAVMSLVINAAEAIGDREGRIEVRAGRRHVPLEELKQSFVYDDSLREGPFVFISVTDDGPGLPTGVASKIFDPFFTTKFQGRGLGLAAVLGVVRMHHGVIRVESAPGGQTLFEILLPPSQVRRTPDPARPSKTTTGDDPVSRPRQTILVVDDQGYIRDIASRALQARGLSVIAASSGQEGLRMFDENVDRLALVLLDVSMPDLEGGEVLRLIREKYPQLPVIMTSGYNRELVEIRLAGQPMPLFIQKPFDLNQLADSVIEAISD